MGKNRMRRRFDAAFKARVALAAIRGDKTLSELASEHQVHANLISQGKRRLLANVARVFEEPEDDAREDHQAVVEEPFVAWLSPVVAQTGRWQRELENGRA